MNNARRGNTAGIFIFNVVGEGFIPPGRLVLPVGAAHVRPCTSRNRPAYGKPAGRACPALQRYCVSSCSISSFFSGNSAAGSALKVRMPSFK